MEARNPCISAQENAQILRFAQDDIQEAAFLNDSPSA
jgi:hypothetical protein